MSIKLYSFAASDYNDCMKLTVKEFNKLPFEERQAIKTIIIPTGYGNSQLNFDGFNRLEHLYLPDDYKITQNNYAINYGKKKHAHLCADTNPVLKQIPGIKFDWVNGYEIINEITEIKNTFIDKTAEHLMSSSGVDFNNDVRFSVCLFNEMQKFFNELPLNIDDMKKHLRILNELETK